MKTELKRSYKNGRMFKRHVYRLATPSLLCRNHPIEDRTELFSGLKMNRSGAPPVLKFSKRLDLSQMHGNIYRFLCLRCSCSTKRYRTQCYLVGIDPLLRSMKTQIGNSQIHSLYIHTCPEGNRALL